METTNILALSGSLREASYNTRALKALQTLAPDHIEISIGSIAELPLFNPDLEGTTIPALDDINSALENADGLIIASPEYAHGISGPMKNALDWMVGGAAFPHKPIMLVNTSPRAFHAQDSLKEVLTTMSGNVVDAACVAIPLLGSNLDAGGVVENRDISNTLCRSLEAFYTAIIAQDYSNQLN